MARRRKRRFHERHAFGISKAVGYGSFTLAFLSQITGKDQTNINAQTDLMMKGKAIANSVLGRMTGFVPFSDAGLPKPTLTINPAGVVNKFTGMGIGILILNKVSRSAGFGTIVSNQIGKNFLKGGIIGGFFDDPAPQGLGGIPPSNSNTATSLSYQGSANAIGTSGSLINY